MTPVKSSNIEAVGYDEAARTLTVKFKSGSTHSYAGVSKGEYESMIAAGSVGKYFHANIRSKYSASK